VANNSEQGSAMGSDGRGIEVHIAADFEGLEPDRAGMTRLVRTVCDRFGLERATVSVAVVGHERFRELNRRFLKKNSTSDCLSFDLSDEGESARLFEVIVNGQMALEQAARRGHSEQAELALYAAHALLHNLGFDDSTPQRADEMHRIEDEILKQLGYGTVYNSGETGTD